MITDKQDWGVGLSDGVVDKLCVHPPWLSVGQERISKRFCVAPSETQVLLICAFLVHLTMISQNVYERC